MTPGAHSDSVLLAHVIVCIERIDEYTTGKREVFFGSRLVQDAVVRNLQVLAESTQRLSAPIKLTEPATPWSDISGFRNVLAHGYLALDLEVIWNVIENDLPSLNEAVMRMAERVAAPGRSDAS